MEKILVVIIVGLLVARCGFWSREKKPKSYMGSKPKKNIKGKIVVLLCLLIIVPSTITLTIRLWGMISYDWSDRGHYLLSYSYAFYMLPGDVHIDTYSYGCPHDSLPTHMDVTIDSLTLSGTRNDDTKRLYEGFPTSFCEGNLYVETDDKYIVVENNAFSFREEMFEEKTTDREPTNDEEEMISSLKSTLIKVSIIETIIILIRLFINYKIFRFLFEKLKEYIERDRLGIEPV